MATSKQIPYSKKELYGQGPTRSFTGAALKELAFPLGGIGAGSIALGGWGQLRDWEIRNRPAKGFSPGDSFFTLKAQRKGSKAVTRVLQGPPEGDMGLDGHSAKRGQGEGLPCFSEAKFTGEFPTCQVKLSDKAVPLDVTLEAFNPFIPLNPDDSSIPCAVLTYTLRNRSSKPVKATIYGSLTNIIGDEKGRKNASRKSKGLTALELTNTRTKKRSGDFGTMVLATSAKGAGVLANAPISECLWIKSTEQLWQCMRDCTKWPPRKPAKPCDTGILGVPVTVGAKKTKSITFVIAWHFPNFPHWGTKAGGDCGPGCGCEPVTWKNWYATEWSDALDVAKYVTSNMKRLEAETKLFRDTLFSSTLPAAVLDAVSSQISILHTPTCLRLTDGQFYGFEGCNNTSGCCEGTCTHVWNYAQALPYLFPSLQRSQKQLLYDYCQEPDGWEAFRLLLPLKGNKLAAKKKYHTRMLPAADGQMGGVMQVYREWQVSGDDEWLAEYWPKAKKSLEFAWKYWDADRDGIMEGMQHNTYDIEFYGPNTMMGSLYLGALLAGEKMARHLGDDESADEYRRVFESGSKKTDRELWNGEFYIQKPKWGGEKLWPGSTKKLHKGSPKDGKFPWPQWQYGAGCLSDHLIGQWYCEMLGLGHVYKAKNITKALAAIFRHNWKSDLVDHNGYQRLYALGHEAGLLVCSWPGGEATRPGHPFIYADEVWCGMEYQVASHLIYEGMVDEGLAIVKGVRDRHDGLRRNPWDEFECGHHYSRSMASYAVMLALQGFSYSAPEKRIGFDPKVNSRDFSGFWCVGSGYGVYSQRRKAGKTRIALEVTRGTLAVKTLTFAPKAKRATVSLGGRRIPATVEAGRLVLKRSVTVRAGRALSVVLS